MSSPIGGRPSIIVTFATALMTVAVTASVVSCSADDPIDGVARTTAAFNLIVDAVSEAEFAPVAVGDPLPVLYVTGRESKVPFDVQVAVAASHVDVIDIRFADQRSEAIDEGLDGLPVRDAGVLLVVGPVPESGRRLEVDVEIYRNSTEADTASAVIRWSAGAWILESLDFAGT